MDWGRGDVVGERVTFISFSDFALEKDCMWRYFGTMII